jgi:predicted nucleic acid-binding protein
MRYLVDANVLSEATKPAPDRKVVDWMSANERNLVVDSIVLGELCLGVLSLPAGHRRARLDTWFDAIAKTVVCLPWDEHGLTVVTRNVIDFRQTGVKVVNPFA